MENKILRENVIIIKGTLTEEKYKSVFEDIKKRYEEFEVEKIEELGKKRLAYEVKQNTTGYYLIIEFYGDDEEVKTLENYCRNNENIIKWIFVRK